MSNEITLYQEEVNKVMADPATIASLLETTFKGLTAPTAKKAMMEGMIRGFTLKDFFEKNVYAVPFGGGYALVKSIDYCRKVGAKNGIVGKDAPIFEERDGKLFSCTITLHKKIGDTVGKFTDTVYYDEYAGKGGQWATKPRTMLAKVCEMHVLRMACPEALSGDYDESEYQTPSYIPADVVSETRDADIAKLMTCQTLDELKEMWKTCDQRDKEVIKAKDEMKIKLSAKPEEPKQEFATPKE